MVHDEMDDLAMSKAHLTACAAYRADPHARAAELLDTVLKFQAAHRRASAVRDVANDAKLADPGAMIYTLAETVAATQDVAFRQALEMVKQARPDLVAAWTRRNLCDARHRGPALRGPRPAPRPPRRTVTSASPRLTPASPSWAP